MGRKEGYLGLGHQNGIKLQAVVMSAPCLALSGDGMRLWEWGAGPERRISRLGRLSEVI